MRSSALISALLFPAVASPFSPAVETTTPLRRRGGRSITTQETLARPSYRTSLRRATLADNDNDSAAVDNEPTGHTVEVTYEGRTVEVTVRPDESILTALERTGAADDLAISAFPQDCRRGNCLTCTGRLIGEGSSDVTSLRRGDDGLAPNLSEEVREKGYVLTCSSYVVGDGVKVELGSNAEAWDDIYKSRYEGPEAERIGQEARAKVLRLAAESNVPKWTKETEEVLEKSG